MKYLPNKAVLTIEDMIRNCANESFLAMVLNYV